MVDASKPTYSLLEVVVAGVAALAVVALLAWARGEPGVDGRAPDPEDAARGGRDRTMSDQEPEVTTADPATPVDEPKRRFTLPSAYTILFALIVVIAIATWIIPAGTYALDDEGSPIPGTYEEVESTPQRIVVDSLNAPINGLYGIEDPATGNVGPFNSGELFGAIDVALFILVIGGFIGITMKTGRDPGGDRPPRHEAPGPRAVADPAADDGVRHRRARPSAWRRRAWPSTSSSSP